jgi:hypothetical protein
MILTPLSDFSMQTDEHVYMTVLTDVQIAFVLIWLDMRSVWAEVINPYYQHPPPHALSKAILSVNIL